MRFALTSLTFPRPVRLWQLVWVETPTNPTMKLVDIAAVAEVVKKHPKVRLVVDNTFMSSYCQVRRCGMRGGSLCGTGRAVKRIWDGYEEDVGRTEDM